MRTAITTTYRELIQWTKRRGKNESLPPNGMLPQAKEDGSTYIPTVWFNPLYYRETSQVWAGMAHAILYQLADRLSRKDRELFWFRLQQSRINTGAIRSEIHNRILRRFLPIGIGVAILTAAAVLLGAFFPAASLASSVATLLGGAGVSALAYGAFQWIVKHKGIDSNFEKYVTEPNYRSELGLLHLIDHDLDRALGLLAGKRPIALFIDDLDRCDPQTVSQVILAINQFLSLPRRNVYFFLGMDMEMVAAALEQAQKDAGVGGTHRRSFGWRFMEKFVQLPFVIPHLERRHAQEFAEVYLRGKRMPATPRGSAGAVDESRFCADGLRPRRRHGRTAARNAAPGAKPSADRGLEARRRVDEEQRKQWLRNEPETLTARGGWSPTIAEIEKLATRATTLKLWCNGMTKMSRGAPVPAYLTDGSLHRYLRKLVTDPPGLQQMYEKGLF